MTSVQTTVPVMGETLRRLRGSNAAGASFDEVLNELMDEIPPAAFIREHLRRLHEEETESWESVRTRL